MSHSAPSEFPSVGGIFCVPPTATLRTALRLLIAGRDRTVVVATTDLCVQGVLTEGDVTKALWHGVSLETPVSVVATQNPLMFTEPLGDERLARLFTDEGLLSVQRARDAVDRLFVDITRLDS
jgi:CBS domain-containing protein